MYRCMCTSMYVYIYTGECIYLSGMYIWCSVRLELIANVWCGGWCDRSYCDGILGLK